MTTPAILTEPELRAWLRAVGLKGFRLPRRLDVWTEVSTPAGDCWQLQPLVSGAFLVRPYLSADHVAPARTS